MTAKSKSAKDKQKKIVLKLEPRKELGKKVKKLRREGIIPANIYGRDFKSTPVKLKIKDFLYIYRKAKETRVVYLNLDGKKEIPSLITNIQRHPITDNILHVDFRKIDLKKQIETTVPVKLKGESEAIKEKGGVILTLSKTLTVEALPEKIPSFIEVDISSLTEIGQEIKVNQLPKYKDFIIKEPKDKVIVSITAHKEEAVAPETPPTAEEAVEEKKEQKQEVKTEAKEKPTKEEKKPSQPESSPK